MTEPKSMLRVALGLTEDEGPFPWQEDLLVRFRQGKVPYALDIPTGLGKTSVMAVWLVARACQSKLPRRLVYIVDRRAVVDQATDEAMRLRRLVDSSPDLRARLCLCGGQSLPISTLRGQFVDNREWLEDPANPAIIVGTVDMVGSRLLFQGYGVSRKMRPYHAGLLCADSLFVLDEAHLVPPFEHLLRSVATDPALRPRGERYQRSVPPFRLLALSATGLTRGDGVVGLTEGDLEHKVARRRLHAKKSLRIEALDIKTKLEDALAQQAWTLADNGKKAVRVVVYSDSREVARKAKEAVERLAKDQTELFVGGRRVFEREEAKQKLQDLGFMAGSTVERSGPVFLFATSAGEVGVDLDADHMVCDLVAWERMIQRLGRVNRRGDGAANVVVIGNLEADDKILQALKKQQLGEELSPKERKAVEEYTRAQRQLAAIKKLPKNDDDTYDASPGGLRDLKMRAATDQALQKILLDATTSEPLRPALTRPLVDAWAMTSLEKHTGRPAIQPWLRGWVGADESQTAVVWRRHLPVRAGGPLPRERDIEAFFDAAPVHTSEILETDTSLVSTWIVARAGSVRKQRTAHDDAGNESRLLDEEVVAFALDRDGGLLRAFALAELAMEDRKEIEKKLTNPLKGATVVLDARLGGLNNGLLDADADTLPPTVDGQEWLGEGAVGFRVRSVHGSAGVPRERNWLERFRFATDVTQDGEVTRSLIVEKWRDEAGTEDDRSLTNRQRLDQHQSLAEAHARRLAQTLDLDNALADVLALAARRHDEGKRAARWQRAFRAPGDGAYAKTEGPIDHRLLDGYRHEFGTLLRLQNSEQVLALSEEDRDLVLHLIAAHHGFARPVIGTTGCEDAPPSALEEKAAEIALRFARLQHRWGPWGLAWVEALLRAADQQASRANDERADRGGGA